VKVLVLTDIPSPYQVELFNEIAAQGKCELEVAYLRGHDPQRQWQSSQIRHESMELSNGGMTRARESVRRADLVVFNYYLHANAERLIDERAREGGPWCFWGERPGFRQPLWIGRLVRKWKLAKLHTSPAPIWGIGEFAIDGYKQEFGSERDYFNLPYFSDLKRFETCDREEKRERVFLFCGSLIARKGVDLLASAFARLEVANVRLRIVGDGPLRESLMQKLAGVKERVEFVGFRDWQELPGEYAAADVLCVPSRYDGWGLVVPEGLAAGLPVIATDRMGAALEFVRTGKNGWLIPAADEEALLRALREAAVGELPSGARDSVSEHTLEHGAERFSRYAHEVVAGWFHTKAQRQTRRHKEKQSS
jgi:glycosyltransferase involved in cell wall biosynthesis